MGGGEGRGAAGGVLFARGVGERGPGPARSPLGACRSAGGVAGTEPSRGPELFVASWGGWVGGWWWWWWGRPGPPPAAGSNSGEAMGRGAVPHCGGEGVGTAASAEGLRGDDAAIAAADKAAPARAGGVRAALLVADPPRRTEPVVISLISGQRLAFADERIDMR